MRAYLFFGVFSVAVGALALVRFGVLGSRSWIGLLDVVLALYYAGLAIRAFWWPAPGGTGQPLQAGPVARRGGWRLGRGEMLLQVSILLLYIQPLFLDADLTYATVADLLLAFLCFVFGQMFRERDARNHD